MGAKRLSGVGQSLKLSTKAAVFKRVSMLIGGAKHVDWGARPPLAPALLCSHIQLKWAESSRVSALQSNF